MSYTVYSHRNKINGKIYIGITGRDPEERWGKDGNQYKSSPHFYSAIQKYGWDNFEHIILYTGLTKEEACLKEQELIKKFNSIDRRFGYNSTSGGECGSPNEDTKKKISKALMGNKNSAGHACSEEKKKKISQAQKGKIISLEQRQKMSESAKKRHVPCSEAKKQTIKEKSHKKPVYCKELNMVFESVQECGRQLNISATTICRVCRGKQQTTGGYHFQYYNDTINA